MKKVTKIIAGITLASIVGLLMVTSRRRRNKEANRNRSARVAEEGYETAYDILFPHKVYGSKKKQPL